MNRAYYHQAERYVGIKEHLKRVSIESPSDLADFFYAYHTFVAAKHYKAIKSDDIWQHLSALDRVIPNRRYIRLIRDPRENALSITNKRWGPCHIYYGSCFVRDQLKLYGDEVARNAGISMTAKYETLLSDPHAFIGDFAAFSGIDPGPDTERKLRDLKIRAGNCEKWRRLPKSRLAICESVLASDLEEHDYARATAELPQIGRAQVLQMRVEDLRKRVPQRVRNIWRMRVVAR